MVVDLRPVYSIEQSLFMFPVLLNARHQAIAKGTLLTRHWRPLHCCHEALKLSGMVSAQRRGFEVSLHGGTTEECAGFQVLEQLLVGLYGELITPACD